METMYAELRVLAEKQLASRDKHKTLGPTALVHELFFKFRHHPLGDLPRENFLNVAAAAMKRLIVDYMRRKGALSRGGANRRVTLEDIRLDDRSRAFLPDEIELIDDLLDEISSLSETDEQAVCAFRLQFILGMSHEECAVALGISKDLVKRRLHYARAQVRLMLARRKGLSYGSGFSADR